MNTFLRGRSFNYGFNFFIKRTTIQTFYFLLYPFGKFYFQEICPFHLKFMFIRLQDTLLCR